MGVAFLPLKPPGDSRKISGFAASAMARPVHFDSMHTRRRQPTGAIVRRPKDSGASALPVAERKFAPLLGVVDDKRLRAKKAVVTGAARGIGRAIAEAFAKEGADVVGIEIARSANPVPQYLAATLQDLEETGRLVMAQGQRFFPMVADVRDLAALRRSAQGAERRLGGVDILVVNTDVQTFAPFSDIDDRQWHDIADVNLTGATNALLAFAPGMIGRRKGRIIFTASGYSASKWGVLELMKTAAVDLGEFSITVNAVDPGLTDTMLVRNTMQWRAAIAEAGEPAPKESTESVGAAVRKLQSTPGGQWSDIDNPAPVFVYLASDAATMLSGAAYCANARRGADTTAWDLRARKTHPRQEGDRS
jgi:NAD(P)-dependent dehydrogenase (short-subunit alcohol dehydrogenase family)